MLLIMVLIILTEKQTRIPYAHEVCVVLWLVGDGVEIKTPYSEALASLQIQGDSYSSTLLSREQGALDKGALGF